MQSFSCESIRKCFGGTIALSDVSLKFEGPQIVAIVGPNGAGKTTLLNVLTGLTVADEGVCLLDGREINGLAPEAIVRAGIGRTFQELRLIQDLRVLDNVLLGFPNQRGEDVLAAILGFGVAAAELRNRRHALRLLERLGLAGKAMLAARGLSYGEQKLLSLACCLATGAGVLLLDEPVAGVGGELVKRILGC